MTFHGLGHLHIDCFRLKVHNEKAATKSNYLQKKIEMDHPRAVYLFFLLLLKRDLLLLRTATLVATKEITLTHTITFDNEQSTLSATKEHKNTSNLICMYVCLITDFQDNNY